MAVFDVTCGRGSKEMKWHSNCKIKRWADPVSGLRKGFRNGTKVSNQL